MPDSPPTKTAAGWLPAARSMRGLEDRQLGGPADERG